MSHGSAKTCFVSQSGLDGQNAVIVIFGMEGCGACEHFIPRFLVEASALREQQHLPFVMYEAGQQIPQGAIPIVVLDAASTNVDVQQLADKYQVHATPTILILQRGAGVFKAEGSLANNQIQWLLFRAAEFANG